MHNSERLVKGPPRCTLLIHPDDAARAAWPTARPRSSTRPRAIELPVEVTDAMMRGVVSVPHGWGHGRAGVQLRVAQRTRARASTTSSIGGSIDELSGTARCPASRSRSALCGPPPSDGAPSVMSAPNGLATVTRQQAGEQLARSFAGSRNSLISAVEQASRRSRVRSIHCVQRQQCGADVAQPGQHAVELSLVCDRSHQRQGAIVGAG